MRRKIDVQSDPTVPSWPWNDAKLALDWRFGRPDGARWDLEQRFGRPDDVKVALERRFGDQTAFRWPWDDVLAALEAGAPSAAGPRADRDRPLQPLPRAG